MDQSASLLSKDLQTRQTDTTRWNRRLARFVFSRRLECGLVAVIPAALLVHPGQMGYGGVRQALALVLVGCGLLLRIWAGGSAGDHTGESQIKAPRLVTGGPYAFVRNPIYFGTILIGLGMVVLIGDLRLLPLCLLTFLALYILIIPAEERFLRATFGGEYERYSKAVPRMLPRLAPWIGSRAHSFNWRILRGEGRLALILALIYGMLEWAAYSK